LYDLKIIKEIARNGKFYANVTGNNWVKYVTSKVISNRKKYLKKPPL